MSTTTTPVTTVTPADCRGKPSRERQQCPCCGKTFAGGSVVSHRTQWCKEHQAYGRLRQLYCDHCDVVHCWLQEVKAGGGLGIVLSHGARITGRKYIDEFLAKHPQAAGVDQC